MIRVKWNGLPQTTEFEGILEILLGNCNDWGEFPKLQGDDVGYSGKIIEVCYVARNLEGNDVSGEKLSHRISFEEYRRLGNPRQLFLNREDFIHF